MPAPSARTEQRQDRVCTEPAARLSWGIILGHCNTLGCHEHPVSTITGAASGTFAAPDHEAPSYLEFTLTAVPERGATRLTVVERAAEPAALAVA